ncbi:hypothetical protein Cop2CBH44_19730 [Coprobacter secundus subsp. similis]|uniref:Uncharacterized protein n=1 Tax=Coprobacter secundus subsp. similis TaxID=2751153 RepID=A0A7G1HVN9_9BACT|nr:hypothetical protein Cop2CBH44_19730 [Coprobacter secundus subsp. similis]
MSINFKIYRIFVLKYYFTTLLIINIQLDFIIS